MFTRSYHDDDRHGPLSRSGALLVYFTISSSVCVCVCVCVCARRVAVINMEPYLAQCSPHNSSEISSATMQPQRRQVTQFLTLEKHFGIKSKKNL